MKSFISDSTINSSQFDLFLFQSARACSLCFLNFCEGVKRDTLLTYLNPLVERPLKLLTPAGDSVDASEVIFVKVSMRRKGRRISSGSAITSFLFFLASFNDYAVAVERAVECGWAGL